LPPAAAEFYIENTLGSLILRSKINEPSVFSNYYLARSAVKSLFTRPRFQKNILPQKAVFYFENNLSVRKAGYLPPARNFIS
jgi:hypothetical protein